MFEMTVGETLCRRKTLPYLYWEYMGDPTRHTRDDLGIRKDGHRYLLWGFSRSQDFLIGNLMLRHRIFVPPPLVISSGPDDEGLWRILRGQQKGADIILTDLPIDILPREQLIRVPWRELIDRRNPGKRKSRHRFAHDEPLPPTLVRWNHIHERFHRLSIVVKAELSRDTEFIACPHSSKKVSSTPIRSRLARDRNTHVLIAESDHSHAPLIAIIPRVPADRNGLIKRRGSPGIGWMTLNIRGCKVCPNKE